MLDLGKRKVWRVRKALSGLLADLSPVPRVAVFIDGDNTPPRAGDALFGYSNTLGRIASAELFANFAGGGTAGWAAQIRRHGILARQQFNTSTGKNGTDIALAIAALDLAHRGGIECYVIATSDADFAPLAYRLRRSGAKVHGVGSSHAATAFRQSCDVFVTLEELDDGVTASSRSLLSSGNLRRRIPTDAEDHILKALIDLGGARGWVEVSRLGEVLWGTSGRFGPRDFGKRNLTALLEALDSVALDQTPNAARVSIALAARNGSAPSPGNGGVQVAKS